MNPASSRVSFAAATSAHRHSLGELLAASRGTSVPLRGWCRHDAVVSEIWLFDGEVVHARHGVVEGTPAVCAMLDLPNLRFTMERGPLPPRRSVTASWARLCHEARCALVDREPTGSGNVTWLEITIDDLD